MLSDERSIGFLQARRTSTATRPMAVTDALIYNFLTMGVIFPWVYVLGPAAFPGGSIPVAIWIAPLRWRSEGHVLRSGCWALDVVVDP